MKRVLLFLLLLVNTAFALKVQPTSQEVTGYVGEWTSFTVTVINDRNVSVRVTVSYTVPTGQLVLSATQFDLGPNSQFILAGSYKSDQEGDITATLSFNTVNETVQALVLFHIRTKWPVIFEDWVEVPNKVKVGPLLIDLKGVSEDKAFAIIYKDGDEVYKGPLGEYTSDDIKIIVDNAFKDTVHYAHLVIKSPTSYEVEVNATIEEEREEVTEEEKEEVKEEEKKGYLVVEYKSTIKVGEDMVMRFTDSETGSAVIEPCTLQVLAPTKWKQTVTGGSISFKVDKEGRWYGTITCPGYEPFNFAFYAEKPPKKEEKNVTKKEVKPENVVIRQSVPTIKANQTVTIWAADTQGNPITGVKIVIEYNAKGTRVPLGTFQDRATFKVPMTNMLYVTVWKDNEKLKSANIPVQMYEKKVTQEVQKPKPSYKKIGAIVGVGAAAGMFWLYRRGKLGILRRVEKTEAPPPE